MTESERDALTLSLQSGLPYVGLRDMTPDPNLLLYVPAAVARTMDVVPLSLDENVLRLACSTPEADLEPIRGRYPRLVLDVCLSGAQEIRQLRAGMSGAAG